MQGEWHGVFWRWQLEPHMNKKNKKSLELFLSGLNLPGSYNINLEQYPTDAGTAATILMEAYLDGNIENKTVIDMGTGNGIFAIGAGYLGSSDCTGIDVDSKMIDLAKENCNSYFTFIPIFDESVRKYNYGNRKYCHRNKINQIVKSQKIWCQ